MFSLQIMIGAAERKVSESALRYSGMLLFVSAFITVEGVVRYISSDPDTNYGEISDVEYRSIISGLWEVFFGCLGMITGFLALAFDFHAPMLTVFSLVFQILCGAVTFAVYTIEVPVHNFRQNLSPPVYPEDSFNRDQLHLAVSFGYILSGASICAVVQGFQIFCTISLLMLQTSHKEMSTFHLTTFGLWNSLLSLALGASMLVLGGLIEQQEGSDSFNGAYIFPPNFVKSVPELFVSGSLVCLYGLALACGAIGGRSCIGAPTTCGILAWAWLVTVHVLSQIVLVDQGLSGAAAQLVGLVTVLIFAPLFVLEQRDRQIREEIDRAEPTPERQLNKHQDSQARTEDVTEGVKASELSVITGA